MEPNIISSQVLVEPQQDAPAPSLKILTGNSQNYIRVPEPGENFFRPLMVNTWSQTRTTDDSTLLQIEPRREQTKREKKLLEEIHKLESDLRAHSEILSQIQATSARTAVLLGQPTPPPLINPLQIQTVESQSSNPHTSSQAIPEQLNNHNSPTSSVINPLHSTPTESVGTIIAEGSGDVNCEPVEIQMADDDGALSFNSLADSGRLEICLATEDGAESTTIHNNGAPNSQTTSIQSLMPSRSDNIWYDRERLTVSLGPNDTRILSKVYESIDWSTPSVATYRLLLCVFERETLATHSLTGKPSPHNKPLKKMLDPLIIQDVISCVTHKCKVSEKEVRNVIISKCVYENKIMKQQANKLLSRKKYTRK